MRVMIAILSTGRSQTERSGQCRRFNMRLFMSSLMCALLLSIGMQASGEEMPQNAGASATAIALDDTVAANTGEDGNRMIALLGGLLAAAALAGILYWVTRKNRPIYRDPSFNPNNNVINPTLTNPGSNLPSPRNTLP